MIIHALSTHPYADGGVDEVFESSKQFWSFRGKQCSHLGFGCQVVAKSNTTEDIRELSSDVKKQQKKTQHASILLLWCNPSNQSITFYLYSRYSQITVRLIGL